MPRKAEPCQGDQLHLVTWAPSCTSENASVSTMLKSASRPSFKLPLPQIPNFWVYPPAAICSKVHRPSEVHGSSRATTTLRREDPMDFEGMAAFFFQGVRGGRSPTPRWCHLARPPRPPLVFWAFQGRVHLHPRAQPVVVGGVEEQMVGASLGGHPFRAFTKHITFGRPETCSR